MELHFVSSFQVRLNGFNLNKVRNYFDLALEASVVCLNGEITGSLETKRLCGCDLTLLASDEALYESNLNVFHFRYPLMPLRFPR